MENTIKYKKCYAVIFYAVVIAAFLPIVLLATSSVSTAEAYNSDILEYVKNIKKIYFGIVVGDVNYAFDMETFGYGAGMFLVLSLLTFPVQFITNSDLILLVILRGIGLTSFLLSTLIIKKIFQNLISEKRKTTIDLAWLVTCSILAIYPSTSLLITRIHPEMLQLLFVLIGIWLHLKFEDTQKKIYLIFSAIMWGVAIGIKISGGIFLVLPFSILALGSSDMKKKTKDFLLFAVICFTTAIIIICPYIIFNGYDGYMKYRNELKIFSQTLQNMSYSDFDNYKPLASPAEVIKGWFTYAYRHGYASLIWIVTIFLGEIIFTIRQLRQRDYSKLFKINMGIITTFIINTVYYVVKVTRVSVNYYFTPMCLITIIFLFNIFNYKQLKSKYCKILCGVILLSFIPSVRHDFAIYKEQVELSKRLDKQAYRYVEFENWLKEREYPYRSIMLPVSMNLSMTSKDWNWIPDYDKINAEKKYKINTEGGYTQNLEYYISFDEVMDINCYDIFVIDKVSNKDFEMTENTLEDNNMVQIYNDNFVSAYGSMNQGIYDENLNETVSDYIKENIRIIEFMPNEWNGVSIPLPQSTNCNEYKQVKISFELENAQAVQEIRLAFSGNCTYVGENIWHYIISKNLKEGINTFYIEKEDFTLRHGYIDWKNVSSTGIDGVGEENFAIKNLSIALE